MMLKVLYLLAAAVVVTNALSIDVRPPIDLQPPSPTKDCQMWCPRPGQFGQYDCCEGENEVCEDNWPGFCIDAIRTFDNGTTTDVGGCSCSGIKLTGWCDSQEAGQTLCRKTCGYCDDKAICDPSCEHGNCTASVTCTCEDGWTGPTCNRAICDPSCENGGCTTPDTCTCEAGWTGATCEIEVCEDNWPGFCIDAIRTFDNGTTTDVGGCSCSGIKHSGWCDSPNYGQRYCRKTCGYCADKVITEVCEDNWPGICIDGIKTFDNGTTTDVGGCSCSGIKNSGWCDSPNYGQRLCRKTCGYCSDKAICDPSCENGGCTAPNTCTCEDGWTGAACEIEVCEDNWPQPAICIDAIRTFDNGTTTDVGGCSCSGIKHSGWCDSQEYGQTLCRKTCGYCGDKAICDPSCENGGCTAPNTCTCKDGWTGAACEIEVCEDNWPGFCIDGIRTFDNGTMTDVGGCSCGGIKKSGWCDSPNYGQRYCRKTCGYCADKATPGQCPDTSGIITHCAITHNQCFSDAECSKGARCCSIGCGRRCHPVV